MIKILFFFIIKFVNAMQGLPGKLTMKFRKSLKVLYFCRKVLLSSRTLSISQCQILFLNRYTSTFDCKQYLLAHSTYGT